MTAEDAKLIAGLAARLAEHGLLLRGGFRPVPEDGLGAEVKTVLMMGNAGPAMWRCFAATRPHGPDALDRWTAAVLQPIAAACGARLVLPFGGPPYWPFQRWARRAEPVHVSPLGLLIHPDYGHWHAYRGALLLPDELALPAPAAAPSPCLRCAAQPCLGACPVTAFTTAGYGVERCRKHVREDRARTCLTRGCQARLACPIGRSYAYPPAQQAWHMAAFAGVEAPAD